MAFAVKLSDEDKRVLRFLAESEDTPQLPLVQTYAVRALLKRHDFTDETACRWISRNIRMLAYFERRISDVCRRVFRTENQDILARLVLKDRRIRKLLSIIANQAPPRHTHVSESIQAQRRLLGTVFEHHGLPLKASERVSWLEEFERDLLPGLLLVPCQCVYPEKLSSPCKEEILRFSNTPRQGRISRIILADLHGIGSLDGEGVRKLFKAAHRNTSPLL